MRVNELMLVRICICACVAKVLSGQGGFGGGRRNVRVCVCECV